MEVAWGIRRLARESQTQIFDLTDRHGDPLRTG
jgi:hypothetical protein